MPKHDVQARTVGCFVFGESRVTIDPSERPVKAWLGAKRQRHLGHGFGQVRDEIKRGRFQVVVIADAVFLEPRLLIVGFEISQESN